MDSSKVIEMIDQQRWLLNNGLISDNVKNQLFFYGSIVHKEVRAVEVQIKSENKLIEYTIYISADLMRKIDKYRRLSKDTSLFGMWRFARLLKKEGNLDFDVLLNNFVKDFCGPKWQATVNIVDFDQYKDTVEQIDGAQDSTPTN